MPTHRPRIDQEGKSSLSRRTLTNFSLASFLSIGPLLILLSSQSHIDNLLRCHCTFPRCLLAPNLPTPPTGHSNSPNPTPRPLSPNDLLDSRGCACLRCIKCRYGAEHWSIRLTASSPSFSTFRDGWPASRLGRQTAWFLHEQSSNGNIDIIP